MIQVLHEPIPIPAEYPITRVQRALPAVAIATFLEVFGPEMYAKHFARSPKPPAPI